MSIQTGDGVQTHLCTLNAWRQITEPVRADHVERINNRTQNKTKTLIDELMQAICTYAWESLNMFGEVVSNDFTKRLHQTIVCILVCLRIGRLLGVDVYCLRFGVALYWASFWCGFVLGCILVWICMYVYCVHFGVSLYWASFWCGFVLGCILVWICVGRLFGVVGVFSVPGLPSLKYSVFLHF